MTLSKQHYDIPGVPDAWVLARIGYPNADEYYVTQSGVKQAGWDEQLEHPVAIVVQPGVYRRPTAHDIDRVYGLKARFRSYPNDPWVVGTIEDMDRSRFHKWKCLENGLWYKTVQICITEPT